MSDAALMERIERARWWLLQEQPFYGALAMRLVDDLRPDLPTAATDGRSIYWGAAAQRWSDAELRAVLLHETLHCAHQHLWRLPLTTAGNVAGDYASNLIVAGVAGCALPAGALLDKRYAGMAEEEILATLPEDGGSYTDAAGGWQSPEAGSGEDGLSAAARSDGALRKAWQEAVRDAEMAARMTRGTVPADMARMVAEARIRAVDWRAAMAEFIARTTATRADWSRVARRAAGRDYIVPRVRHDALGTIVAVRDTSGSVSERELGEACAAIEAAMAQTGCAAVLLDCDARVQAEYLCEPGDALPREAQGGGGTDFRPAFDRAMELSETVEIAGLIYVTDMAGEFPDTVPEYPVLWVSTTPHADAPFGSIVYLEEK